MSSNPFNTTLAMFDDFSTENYKVRTGKSVSGIRKPENGNVYQIVNKLTGIVEHECVIFFEVLGYLRYMEDNLQELAAPFLEAKVETPEV